MTFFLIVRGPLGAGKTTISQAVAQRLGGEWIAIDPILEQWEWDGGSEELFRRANDVAAERARALLERGTPVVFDGNFYWRSALEDLVRRLPYPSRVFTLKAPLSVCIERDRARAVSYGEESTREVFEKIARFEFGTPVDATRPVRSVVDEIAAQLPRH